MSVLGLVKILRGEIYCESAYARGKMLNHSNLSQGLPRGMSPSDIDAVIDNNGKLLFMEYSSQFSCWADLKPGQRKLYEHIVEAGKGMQMAILVHHAIPPEGVQIDTLKDALEFQIMTYLPENGPHLSRVMPGRLLMAARNRLLGL